VAGAVKDAAGVAAIVRSPRPGARHARMKHQPARAGSSVRPVVPGTAPGRWERLLVGRRLARLALTVLTLGLAALGLLAVDATTRTATASAEIRAMADVGDRWDEFFLQVGVEYEALSDYLRANSAEGRSPLRSAVGGASGTLDWLQQHGSAEDSAHARSIAASYEAYTDSLHQVMDAHDRGDPKASTFYAEQASLSAAALRKQAVANAAAKRAELGRYLLRLERLSRMIQVVTTVIAVLDGLLLAACALILIGHQRSTERQASSSAFRALHDALTGLPNRAYLLDRLESALGADRGPQTGRVVLLLLDLDGFKDINDGLGHHLGDALLAKIARRVHRVATDSTTTVARLGGDEFAVLLDHSSLTAALLLAERIRDEVRRPVVLNGLTAQVGCSIGVAVHPEHGASATELLKSADIAMYHAKHRRLGVSVFSTEGNEHTTDRLVLLSELRGALEAEREVVLHYQPKVHAERGVVCGAEALVRWHHPTRGLLVPGEFMPAAERSDLIIPLTDRVLAIACAQIASWSAEGLVLPVSVNVSVAALIDRGFPRRVADLLAHHDLPPDLVTLEITETALMADHAQTRETLTRLHDLGVELSLDDFGTGYSSLQHLTLPLQELKIDRQFVTHMTTSPQSHAIARAVVDVAHDLGLRVVGEGVEDTATLEALRRLGCDEVQGYQLCRPVPAPELTAWLAGQVLAERLSR
jgi:diguanylate cyclase (GGDEF)-like protein